MAGNGKHIPNRCGRCSHAAGAFCRNVHDARVQRQEIVEATAIQRQILHLALTHKTRNVGRRNFDATCLFSDLHRLSNLPDFQREIEDRTLPQDQNNTIQIARLEPGPFHFDFILAHIQQGELVVASGICVSFADKTSLGIPSGNLRSCNGTVRGIDDCPDN